MLWSPAFQFCWSSTYAIAFAICTVWVREPPCFGRSEAIRKSGLPEPLNWIGPHDEAGSAVTFPPLLPPDVLPLLLFLLLPQPAATRASAPTAARSTPIETRFLTLPPP